MLIFLVAGMVVVFTQHSLPAYAHSLTPGQNPWTAWNFDDDPVTVVVILLAGLLYIRGLLKWRGGSRTISRWQQVSFFAGLGVLFLALISPLDPMAVRLFSVHMVQHLVLHIVAPILLLLGEPFTPWLRGLPAWALQSMVRPVASGHSLRAIYRGITGPLAASLLFVVSPLFWLLPVTHNLAVRNEVAHLLMHFSLFSSGFLFWWTIIDPRPRRARMPHGLRVLVLAIVTIPHTVMGMIVLLSSSPLYSAYSESGRLWEIDALIDQQIGGVLLLLPGEAIMVTAAAIIGLRWFREEEKKQLAREAAGVDPRTD